MHDLKGITVQNDNGSQFIADKVRHYLRTLDAHQEFTHVVRRSELASFYEAKLTISAYMNLYNNKRRHGSMGRKAPVEK